MLSRYAGYCRLLCVLIFALWTVGHDPRSAGADRSIRVRPGDTLSDISLAYYGNISYIDRIATYNGLGDSDAIEAGQLLILPDLDPPAVDAAVASRGLATHLTGAAKRLLASGSVEPTSTAAEPAPTRLRVGPVVQTGLATWYGADFEGSRTRCGQVYDQWAYTAASNDLPCGTVIEVTNVDNGLSVIVTVTDSGAFRHPNILDLSRGAFSRIASTESGLISVSVAQLLR